jgi:mono/diheme cytochrome c family protein
MRMLRALIVLIVLLALLGIGFAYSGLWDVSASSKEAPWLRQILVTVKDRAIARRAAGITAPPLADPAMVRTGLVHFSEMCVTCHGGPGVPAAELAMGLNPDAPSLAKEGADQSPAQLFWVVKNGIKMTGMPAFGPTHTDEEIWAIVAFLKRLPQLDDAGYAAMLKQAGLPAPGAGSPEGQGGPGSPGEHRPAATPPPAAGAPHGPGAPPPPAPRPPAG